MGDMMLTPKEVKEYMDQFKISPSRKRGQNFLVSERIVSKIMDTIEDNTAVLEIGGGLGALTLPLAQKSKRVVIYEIENVLAQILSHRLEEYGLNKNANVIRQDFTQADLGEEKFHYAVSSLPYKQGATIIHKLIEGHFNQWEEAIFILQSEVVDKMISGPPKAGYWYFFLNYYFNLYEIIKQISPDSFWPQPGVYSSAIKLQRRMMPLNEEMINPVVWSKYVTKLCRYPRKQLRAFFPQSDCPRIDLRKRPGTLSLTEAVDLYLSTEKPLQGNNCNNT